MLLILAKLLIACPLLGLGTILAGIYATASENAWDINVLYDYSISSLGAMKSYHRLIFAVCFTVFCSLIMLSVLIKWYLIRFCWKTNLSQLVNVFMVFLGATMLSVMAWTPRELDNVLHYAAACAGISLCLMSQMLDIVHWFSFCKQGDSANCALYIVTVYSTLCVLLSIAFFCVWLQDTWNEQPTVNAPLCEWLGMLMAVLGFLTQSVHGIFLHRFVSVRADYEPLTKHGNENKYISLYDGKRDY